MLASYYSEHAIRYGIDADAEPLGEAAIWQIASDVVRNWSDDSYRNDSAVSTVIKDLLRAFKVDVRTSGKGI